MRRNSGFTLIELVVVIIILGILAAFAVPRFLGVQKEARISTLQGLKGSIHGAASLTHAKVMASGNSSIPSSDVPGRFEDIDTHEDGSFPAANSSGIVATLQDTSGFRKSSSLTDLNNIGIADSSDVFNVNSGSDGNYIVFYPESLEDSFPLNCAVTYAVNSTDYAVNATTDDC